MDHMGASVAGRRLARETPHREQREGGGRRRAKLTDHKKEDPGEEARKRTDQEDLDTKKT